MKYVYDFLFFFVFWKIAFVLFPTIDLFSWQWLICTVVAIVLNFATENPIKEFLRALGNS